MLKNIDNYLYNNNEVASNYYINLNICIGLINVNNSIFS